MLSVLALASTPSTIIFLTADAYGVLPPVPKLDLNQMMYNFMSGFTSKIAGTECGVTEPVPVFSACFGAPFMPRHPSVYAHMLAEKVKRTDARVYLINTGWNGSQVRIKLAYTQAMVAAAISGVLEQAEFVRHSYFDFEVPKSYPGVPSEIMLPIDTWKDKEAYKCKARELAQSFIENFKKYHDAPDEIVATGPKVYR